MKSVNKKIKEEAKRIAACFHTRVDLQLLIELRLLEFYRLGEKQGYKQAKGEKPQTQQ